MLAQGTIVWIVVLGAAALFLATGAVLYRRDLGRMVRDASIWQLRLGVALLLCVVLGGGVLAWQGVGMLDDQSDRDAAGPPAKTLASTTKHIIYVLDCSGSMIARFDVIRSEAIMNARGLNDDSSLHAILFTNGEVIEGPARRPKPASDEHKAAFADFMAEMRPLGKAGPTGALARAFEQLAGLKGQKRILLVTDGRGLLEDDDGTLKAIEQGNKNADVQILVLLHGPITPEAKQLAEKIAKDTGGVFQNVSANSE